MNIDKAAIYRHLKKMEEGGLVKRFEDHGFVYYGLSWKARDLLSPNENTKIIVLLSTSWVILIAIVLLLSFTYVSVTQGQTGSSGTNGESQGPTSFGNQSNHFNERILGATFDWSQLLSVALPLLIVPAALALWARRLMRKPRQPPGMANSPSGTREPRRDLED
jgi:hypothetical protein